METEGTKTIFHAQDISRDFTKILIDKTTINDVLKGHQQRLEFLNSNVIVAKETFSDLKNDDQRKSYSVELSSSHFILSKKDKKNEGDPALQIFSDTLSENLVTIIDNLDGKISFSIILHHTEAVTVDEEFIKKIAKKNWQSLQVSGKFFMKNEAVIELNKHAVTDIYIKKDLISLVKKSHQEFSSFWYERQDIFPDELLLAAVKSPNLGRILIQGAYPSLETLTILAQKFEFDRIYVPGDYHTKNKDMLSAFTQVKIFEEFNILRKNFNPEISQSKE